MPWVNYRPDSGSPLLPDRSTKEAAFPDAAYQIGAGVGPAGAELGTGPHPLPLAVSLWVTRQQQWYNAFSQRYSANIRRWWQVWRNFDASNFQGVGQDWRDRTNIPESFKIIATRVPRIILGLWGVPEPWTIRGRGFMDERYEEQVRVLIQEALDEIGNRDPGGETFFKRIVDGTTYSQIMGHVWWKAFWRKQTGWLKTAVPTEGGRGWTPVEMLEMLYDNVDIVWLPMTHLAIDIFGRPRRWAIERIRTSMEALHAENDRYKSANGRPLYPGLPLLSSATKPTGLTYYQTDEPRDTERWPLDAHGAWHDPGESPVELWLCWDNIKGTLTKIANRSVILDQGIADTPDRLDPYVGDPAVPIPGQPYGDSILNWTWQLNALQNKIARARADETLLNIFQQYIYREGVIRNTTWFWRPGGGLPVSQANMDRPITDSIQLLPRRPIPPEATNEEIYRQTQQEAIAGADAVSQGVEATAKSRDVTAAEINQRTLQGASRFQLEVFYHEASFKKPLIQKVFDLLRSNLTTPRMVRILQDQESEFIDLTRLSRPVDIVIGGSLFDTTQAERLQEIDRFVNMAKADSLFASFLKPREILLELLRATRTLRRSTARFVKTEEEVAALQAQLMGAGGAAPNAAGGAPMALPPGAGGAGGPGQAGLANAMGQLPAAPPPAAGGAVEEF